MTTRDNAAGKKLVQHLNPASFTTTQTPADGKGIDCKGFDSLAVVIAVGDVADLSASPLGDGSWEFKAQEADTDVNASYVDITDATRILVKAAKSPVVAPNATTGVFLTVSTPAHINNVYHVGVVTSKRFVRIISTAVSTPGASLLAIEAVLEHAGLTPVSN